MSSGRQSYDSAEFERLRALYSYAILDTDRSEPFDRITRLAAAFFNAPIALVSLVDEKRQWFKSTCGLDASETHLEISFCSYAIRGTEIFVVEDATADPRFANHPMVTGPPHIRAYIGAPLISPDGYALGTLCLIYKEITPTDDFDLAHLSDLAAMVMGELEKHRLIEAGRETESVLVDAFAAAKANERLLNSVEAVAQVGGWEVDIASESVRWTDETRAIHEVADDYVPTFEEAINFYAPPSRETITAALRACIDDGTPFNHELQVITGRNRKIWVRAFGQAVQKDGKVVRLVGAFQDITETRREKEALREANAEKDRLLSSLNAFQSALDQHAIVAITDRAGTIIEVNANFCAISGYEESELIGQNHRILNSGTHDKEFFVDMWQEIGKGRSWRADICNRRKDGQLYWVDTTIVPLTGYNGKIEHFISLRYDITDRKQHQKELEAKRIEAESANIAKSQFLAAMSHEIRTPMNGILGMLDVVLESGLTGEQQGQLEIAQTSARGLLSILNDILDFSKLEAGRVELEEYPYSPRAVIRDVEGLFAFQAEEKGLNLNCVIDDDVPDCLSGDATRIRQILINLVSNALKFTESGCVDVFANYDHSTEHFIMDVVDTGIGIPDDRISALFDRFSQADASTTRRFGGSGLGLAISKQLVDLKKGTIKVHSREGEGTRFSVRIPTKQLVAKHQTLHCCDHNTAAPLKDAVPIHILVADDNRVNLLVLQSYLARGGHRVTTVTDGQAAVDAMKTGGFDLILMDVQMPVLDGLKATQKIRMLPAPACDVPIIALTANAMDGDRDDCLNAGMDAHLAKPVDASTLLSTVAEFSSGRTSGDIADTAAV